MSRRGLRVVTASVVAMLLALVGTVFAGADDSADLLLIRRVDTTDPANSKMTFLSTGGDAGAQLSENGTVVDASAPTALPESAKIAVALVFDTSQAMDSAGALVSAKEAAKQWVRNRSGARKDSELMSVYIASTKGQMLQELTSDETRILNAIDKVAPNSDEAALDDTALWGAIRLAANGLAQKTDTHQPNLVVMTANGDNSSGGEEAAAKGQVASSRAAVFGAVYTGGKGNAAGALGSLVNNSGGEVLTTGDGSGIAGLVGSFDTTINRQQYSTTWPSTVPVSEVANLELSAAGQTAKASVVIGGYVQGQQELTRKATTSSGGIAFLQSPLGLLLAIVLVLVAAAGIAYAATLIFVKDDSLSTVLQQYTEGYEEPESEEAGGSSALAKTAIIKRAVELTEQVAEQRGVLGRTEAALERANLPLRAGEALFFYAALVVGVTVLGLAVTGNLLGGLMIGGIAALIPVASVSFLASRRKKAFMSQLPDTLQLLSGTLRAGYSLMQGVEAVSQEVTEPMGLELRRVVTESRLGRPLEEALEGTASRMDSPDFAWAVMAIRIQREVGGNLSELLLTVAETMTARERLRRDVRSLTAEGRMSAIVLGALPVLLGFAMFAINPEYTSQLFKTTLGNIMLGVSVVAIVIGFFWMKKIIDIEI